MPSSDQRWGLTVPLPGLSLPEHEAAIKVAEASGFTDVWSGETQHTDGFTPLALAASWSQELRLGTGVVGVFQRGPALLAMEAAALAEASGGRFALGIGSSSDVIVERWNGIPFHKPLSKVSETIDFLRPALAGEKVAGGFRLERPPEAPIPIIVAALRGKMLAMAAAKAEGAFTNFLPLGGLPRITEPLAEAPPRFELLCRFFCLPGPRERIEGIARFMFASYATVPVYERFFRWLGHGEAIDEMVEAWRARDRDRALAAAPWELIEEIMILGEPDEMVARIQRYVDGGITLPILTPITEPARTVELIEALGPRR
jgi:probable F420-dependent oxidoreductase